MSEKDNKRHPEPELTAKKMVPTKEYGLLKVMEWPDGTIMTLNTKKGEENMRIMHSSGSYQEIRSDGSKISFSSNNEVMYQKGGFTLSVDQSGDVKMDGHGRVSISHDAHIEVAKNASIVAGGRADVHSTGHVKLSAADISLSTTEGSITICAARDVEIKADKGRVLIHGMGAVQVTSDADVHVEAKEDITNVAGQKHTTEAKGGNIESKASGDIKENATGKILEEAGGSIKSKAGSKWIIDAAGKITVGTSGAAVWKTDGGTTIEPTPFPPAGKATDEA